MRRHRRLSYGLVVLSVAVAGGFGWMAADARSALEKERAADAATERLLSILSDPGLTRVPFTASGGAASGSVALATTGDGRGVVLAAGLPKPAAGRSYWVWLINGTTAVAAGTLSVADGHAALVLDRDPRRFGEVLVTSQPGLFVPPAPDPAPLFRLLLRA